MLFGATAVSCPGADCLRSWPQGFDDLGRPSFARARR